ncbi:MAG: F0F1 ATP synthase subunit A [Thermoflavifilum sp.]|nr:F0F1 ATP synthase subunit A [Thermoflavifilum sp.]MCL6513187.1 F0F1 ATP synthase subunit A [Alicyclobacillus sp.]
MPAFPTLFRGTAFAINLTTIAMMVLTGLVVLIVMRLAVRRLDMRHPRGLQNVIEWIADFAATTARDAMPSEKAARSILPLAMVMLVYLFVANWLGLIATIELVVKKPVPWLGLTPDVLEQAHGRVALFDSPTANMSMTLGLAIMVWLMSHARGLRHPREWAKHFLSPTPWVLPLTIIEEITNPLTHGMRLFGNIFAGEALMGVILGIPLIFGWVPVGLPLLLIWLFYSAFVSTIQAYVFTILMCLYIGNKSFDEGHAH